MSAAPNTFLTRAAGPRRGFSLIDVAIGVTLFAALFAAGLTFLMSLNNSAETSFARSQLRGQVNSARSALEADLGQAQSCAGGRVAAVFAEFGDDAGMGDHAFAVWVDADSDGKVDLVGWRVEGERLQRAVKRNTDPNPEPTAGCEALLSGGFSTGAWRNVLGGVRMIDEPNATYFQGVRDGYPAYYRGSCAGAAGTECHFDDVRVRLVAEPSDAAGPARVDETFRVGASPLNG